MKKLKKLLLVFAITLSTLCLALGLVACDKNGDKEQITPVKGTAGLSYELSDDGTYYTCSGIGTCTATKIVIGNTYNNLPVTGIQDFAFEDRVSLTSVTIADGVTRIGSYTFSGCSALTKITIPNSVTGIWNGAFSRCSALTSVLFENTSGWSVIQFHDASSKQQISSDDLSDSANAATYLTSNFCDYYWLRG